MAMSDAARHPGLLLIISGPSGVGKTSITHQVERTLNGKFSVSMTTRPKTEEDVDGEDYFFVSRDEFEHHIQRGELLEWAEVFGDYYGTPRRPVEQSLEAGNLVILEIDVQGARQIKANMPGSAGICILPPDESSLLDRLRQRRREDEAKIQKRFDRAKHEIEQAKNADIYDAFIVNDNLDRAVNEAVELVQTRLNER
jgi:guanylate kinase